MNVPPPYFKQERRATCSLACLRMVLASRSLIAPEKELVNKVTGDYGNNFKNIWNPTIAKLARQYGIEVRMYALWPLFKDKVIEEANYEYQLHPKTFNYKRYENPKDTDTVPEPLPLAYREMFAAYQLGCLVIYGTLTRKRITTLLSQKALIQTSVRLHRLYLGKKRAFHSILIYHTNRNLIYYHDPTYGERLSCTFERLLGATSGVGAFLAYV